eukprot:TRINITY_DN2384_c0_g2_i1.p1 TRINITY_DN2384_c0_g2~~TRINITY_DN2384_c0_g2_i1.p1  ORF type:complete len:473 (+),score=86.67 TRINITY_DN2384_c0_g2_i1:121-1419(+)
MDEPSERDEQTEPAIVEKGLQDLYDSEEGTDEACNYHGHKEGGLCVCDIGWAGSRCHLFDDLPWRDENIKKAAKIHFTHVINPFSSKSGSEWDLGQRITFATIRDAVSYALKQGIFVEVLAVTFPGEEYVVESPVRAIPLLSRSMRDLVLDRSNNTLFRQIPLIDDLLRLAYKFGRGEHVVYTNIDIGLKPYFYVESLKLLSERNLKSVTITRRTIEIPSFFESLKTSPFTSALGIVARQLYRHKGEEHPGWDTFVFPRRWAREMSFSQMSLAWPPVGCLFCLNLRLLSGGQINPRKPNPAFGFHKARDQFLTFHIGNSKTWKTPSAINLQAYALQHIYSVQSLMELFDKDAVARILTGADEQDKFAARDGFSILDCVTNNHVSESEEYIQAVSALNDTMMQRFKAACRIAQGLRAGQDVNELKKLWAGDLA